tara:strand:- start:103 stop:261 length:159 start_codon:yes stop_codon:yes gene_type:complete
MALTLYSGPGCRTGLNRHGVPYMTGCRIQRQITKLLSATELQLRFINDIDGR